VSLNEAKLAFETLRLMRSELFHVGLDLDTEPAAMSLQNVRNGADSNHFAFVHDADAVADALSNLAVNSRHKQGSALRVSDDGIQNLVLRVRVQSL